MHKVQGPASLDQLNIVRTIGPSPQLHDGVYWTVRSENIHSSLDGRKPSSALLSSSFSHLYLSVLVSLSPRVELFPSLSPPPPYAPH